MVLHFSMYNFKNMQFWAITLEKKIKRALELKIKRGVKIVQCINKLRLLENIENQGISIFRPISAIVSFSRQ